MSKSEAIASPAVQLNVNEPSSAIPSKGAPGDGEQEAVAYRVDEYSHAACSYTSWGFYMFCGLCMLLVVIIAAIAALIAAVVAVRGEKMAANSFSSALPSLAYRVIFTPTMRT
jgi:hypothetical protein